MDGVVLVLNQNYEPLNVCNIPRAFRLVFGSKAEVIEYDHAEIRTVRDGLPGPVRDPAPAPRSAARGRASSSPGARSSPATPHLPVLRPAGARPDPRPRRPAPSRRQPHVGEPRRRVQAVQPPQGRPNARRGALAAAADAVRAAQRRLLAVHAVPRGRPERGLAGLPLPRPELTAGRGRRRTPRAAAARRRPVPGRSSSVARSRSAPAGTRPTWSAAASATRCWRRDAADWDVATDARPDRLVGLFPGARYENRFGTVAVRRDDGCSRSRRSGTSTLRGPPPAGRREFGDDLDEDLARRDFTVNAMACPARPSATADAGTRLVDPFGGRATSRRGILRAVGDPRRAVPRGRAADAPRRPLRGHARASRSSPRPARRSPPSRGSSATSRASGRRRAVATAGGAERPSVGLRLAAGDGPAGRDRRRSSRAQRGIPQAKIAGRGPVGPHAAGPWTPRPPTRPGSCGSRRCSTTSASRPPCRRPLRRPRRGRGASSRRRWLAGSGFPRALRPRTSPASSATTCSRTTRTWSDAAVRRFIRRVGRTDVDDLLDLRAADNVGSGLAPDDPASCGSAPASTRSLRPTSAARPRRPRVDGDDLMRALALAPGPRLGRLLDALLERVIADPMLNERADAAARSHRACLPDVPDARGAARP